MARIYEEKISEALGEVFGEEAAQNLFNYGDVNLLYPIVEKYNLTPLYQQGYNNNYSQIENISPDRLKELTLEYLNEGLEKIAQFSNGFAIEPTVAFLSFYFTENTVDTDNVSTELVSNRMKNFISSVNKYQQNLDKNSLENFNHILLSYGYWFFDFSPEEGFYWDSLENMERGVRSLAHVSSFKSMEEFSSALSYDIRNVFVFSPLFAEKLFFSDEQNIFSRGGVFSDRDATIDPLVIAGTLLEAQDDGMEDLSLEMIITIYGLITIEEYGEKLFVPVKTLH